MRYLIYFRYDGTLFHGFQSQKDFKSVQCTLEQAISKVLGLDIEIKGSGRTDAGVHAICQAAHFDYDGCINKNIIGRINEELNGDIVIFKYKLVSNDFHARHSVKKKIYVYKINNGIYQSNYDGFFYQIKYKLDIKTMKNVSKLFIGYHNFRNFVSGYRDDYNTYIYNIKIKRQKDIITMEFVGTGFYRYMVRHLVGALLDVGRGKVDEDLIKKLLNNSIDKESSVAPADGLYLMKVVY